MTTRTSAELRGRAITGLVKVLVVLVVFAAVLFLSVGRLDWWPGWAYIGVAVVNAALLTLLLPVELQAERSGFQEGTKKWDIVLVLLMARVGPLAMLIVAGLDARWGWSGAVAPGTQVAAWAVLALGLLVSDWAMLANRFFAATVRIQTDRGHTVVTHGPYRAVRHPGYAGSILVNLATPFVLGALWALIPTVLVALVTVLRTALEDRTLQAELPGYADYARRVRYRLLPGAW